MVHLIIMQTALIDSYAVIPLVASLLVEFLSIVFLLNIQRESPEKLPTKSFFTIPFLGLIVLVLVTILAIIQASLFVVSFGIFIVSILLLVLLRSIQVFNIKPVQETELPEEVIQQAPEETAQEDPLIKIGQDFLMHVSECMTGEINLTRLLDFVNETQIKHTCADGGVILIADDFEDIIVSKSFKGVFPPPYKLPQDLPHKPVRVETNFRYAQFNLGETIFGEVAATGKPMLIENGVSDPRVFTNGPEEFLKTGSYIVVPLMVKGRVIGVSGMARTPESKPFTEADLKIAEILSDYAGSSINNIYSVQEVLEHADLEREASIASRIQKTLHPKRLPELPEVGFGAFFNATKGVCGDYYDVILARRDRITVTIGDVAGKGIQSSMVMIMIRSILQLVTNTTKDSSTVLDWVNKGITGKIDMDHYATLSVVTFSSETHEVDYSNAGHQPMLIWKTNTKKIEIIKQISDPIGVERSSKYVSTKLTVVKGDIIILLTDGLIEALNQEGRQYGLENLSKVITEKSSATAKEIAAEIKHNIQAFLGSASLHDDQTLVVMKIKV